MFLRQVFAIFTSYLRQYLPRSWLVARQNRLLTEQLRFCLDTVPFYQKNPAYALAGFRGLANLSQLPIIAKDDLRRLPPEEFQSSQLDRPSAVPYKTSGSTGKNVEGLHDRRSHDYHTGACFRRFFATGIYWPHYRLVHLRPYKTPNAFYESFGLFRRHTILTHRPLPDIIAEIASIQPHILLGVPSFIRELKRSARPDQLAAIKRHLRAVFTESELINREHRKVLGREFGVPVFDEYSAFEVLNIYFECAHHRCHIAEDRVKVEIVDDRQQLVEDGQEGHIVITNFTERGMPLIRYRTGDIGLIEKDTCPCGRSFKCMRLTKGRTNDRIILPDGRPLYWTEIILFGVEIGIVSECHLYQKKDGAVVFYYIPYDPRVSHEACERPIREKLYELGKQSFPLTIERVQALPFTDQGKAKLVRSDYA